MNGNLSTNQKGIYLECVANPASTIYNLPFLGRFREEMDPEKLRAALLAAVKAHPALSTVLVEDGDGYVRLEVDEKAFDIPVIELSDEEFAEKRKTLVRPFGLNGDRLARFEIYRTPTALWLFEDIHHIICDGSSSAVLSDGIRRALDGMEPEAEKISVFDIAKAEEEWLASEDAKKAREYWEGLLSGCEAPSEPERDRWEDTPK